MKRLTLICVLLAACANSPAAPVLDFGDDTPDDLRVLASATFEMMSDAFPARQECLGGLSLVGAWELDDRALYNPDRNEVTVRIPATAAQLETSIVHEFGHHLEYTCPPDIGLRDAFLTAQGFGSEADWFAGSSWENTPSEQWASAVVIHVLGRPDERAGIVISPAALEVVRGWVDPT